MYLFRSLVFQLFRYTDMELLMMTGLLNVPISTRSKWFLRVSNDDKLFSNEPEIYEPRYKTFDIGGTKRLKKLREFTWFLATFINHFVLKTKLFYLSTFPRR